MTAAQKNLLKDGLYVFVSIIVAYIIVKTGIVHATLATAKQYAILGSFIAGISFASIFTVAPAIVVLAELGRSHPPLLVAAVGAVGAVLGDLVIFRFMRNRVGLHLAFLFNRSKSRLLKKIFKRRALKVLLPVLGALIIASPLPDELGLAFMGISNIKTPTFIPLSYGMNFLGILVIAYVARASAL